MSIILESLSKQEANNDDQLPNIHSSHFDDEMMSDEWLISRVRKWKYIAFFLMFLVALSWTYIAISLSENLEKNNELADKVSRLEKSLSELKNGSIGHSKSSTNSQRNGRLDSGGVIETEAQFAFPNEVVYANSSMSTPEVTAENLNTSSAATKRTYQPQKQQVEKNNKRVSQRLAIAKPAENNHTVNTKNRSSVGIENAIDYESLSNDFKASLPNLVIHSFVIAEDPKDSFVIIDGIFYSENQVISPKLVLRKITKDYIVVEHPELFFKVSLQ